MSVYQVEQYYVSVEFGSEENFELIRAELKSLMENHDEQHDYELNDATITEDDFESNGEACSFQEEIHRTIEMVNSISK